MKKLAMSLSLLIAATAPALASPYTPSLISDLYDPTPNGIVTPNNHQDEQGTAGNDLFDAVNAVAGTSYTHNNQLDAFQYLGQDAVWQDLSGPNSKATFTLIGLGAGAWNTLSIYDINSPSTFTLPEFQSGFGIYGDGTSSNPFAAIESPFSNGTQFGFHLRSIGDGPLDFDSDPTKNADGVDHMITYRLSDLQDKTVFIQLGDSDTPVEYTFKDPYLIGWEDLAVKNGKLGDEDFNDLVFLVDRVAPVAPEPVSTILFLTGGMAMAGGLVRRRKTQLAV